MPAYITRGIPLTYVIDYDDHLNRIEEVVERVRQAPPSLFHGGQDFTYVPRTGASDFRSWKGKFSKDNPAPWCLPLTPEQAKRRVAETRRWTREMHAAGVDAVIPYICNQTAAGDPQVRSCLWWFYDHWDEYADDVGPKPAADPIDWMQREPDGRLHFNYPYRFVRLRPPLRFATCPNNPYWHDWLKRVVRMLAEYDFDGVFVDNNILHCHCEHCQKEFHTYLNSEYTASQLRRRFGSEDVSGLRLATLGDVVLWATAQRRYLEEIRTNEPDEFVEKFGTDDVDRAIPSEAGNGFHWGRSYDFRLRLLRERHSDEGFERIMRTGDISDLGVRTPVEHCLWADTQKFWAWSVGQRNAELREAAEKIKLGFIVVPNWGDMSGFRHTVSRIHEGKNVRLWGPGADIMFFEEEYFPGTLAPGYTFDLMIPYKYSAACGSRSCALPYRGSDREALCELATAEAATWGGDAMFVQPHHRFPEIRNRYRRFFTSHRDWYERRSSYASVGLALSFDEAHMENTHHLREAYSISRYLADHHVLFDFINERQFALRELRRFEVVIVPHVQYLPLGARGSLSDYVKDGGGVVFTGNTGAFDENARLLRKRDLVAEMRMEAQDANSDALYDYRAEGGAVWVNDVYTLLPKRAREMHDLADLSEEQLKPGVIAELRADSATEVGRDTRFLEVLDRLAGRPLPVVLSGAPPTLRVSAWIRSQGRPSVVAHFLNYDIPGPGTDDADGAKPVENIEASIPLPEGMAVAHVLSASPWDAEPQKLTVLGRTGNARFVVPRVDIYRAVWIG